MLTMKNVFTAFCMIAALCCVFSEAASAARIYNFLNTSIDVRGSNDKLTFGLAGSRTSVAPNGGRSDSLAWKESYVNVQMKTSTAGTFTVCTMGWFPHYDLQGGNYLVVYTEGGGVPKCILCNPDHNVISNGYGYAMQGLIGSYRSSHTGC
jgi:hypothetical protein